MGLTMDQRKALTREMADRYRRASKRQKTAMLDEFVELLWRDNQDENAATIKMRMPRRLALL